MTGASKRANSPIERHAQEFAEHLLRDLRDVEHENERLREALENISTGAWGSRAHQANYDVRTFARNVLSETAQT